MKKILISRGYYGFLLSNEAKKELNIENYSDETFYKTHRNDEKLIECFEKLGDDFGIYGTKFIIVYLPDETTDFYIDEYDGVETVIYVIDGKLHFNPRRMNIE